MDTHAIASREDFKRLPEGVSACQCSCGSFYPLNRNPDSYGKDRNTLCSSCGEQYDYPEERLFVQDESWKFLDETVVKESYWFHATLLSNWKKALSSDPSGEPLVHVGQKEAAQSIADIYRRNGEERVYLHALKLREEAVVSEDFLRDDNDWAEYVGERGTERSVVHRYVNDHESPGSISLLVPAESFEVVGTRTIEF